MPALDAGVGCMHVAAKKASFALRLRDAEHLPRILPRVLQSVVSVDGRTRGAAERPDALQLYETKCSEHKFPALAPILAGLQHHAMALSAPGDAAIAMQLTQCILPAMRFATKRVRRICFAGTGLKDHDVISLCEALLDGVAPRLRALELGDNPQVRCAAAGHLGLAARRL